MYCLSIFFLFSMAIRLQRTALTSPSLCKNLQSQYFHSRRRIVVINKDPTLLYHWNFSLDDDDR